MTPCANGIIVIVQLAEAPVPATRVHDPPIRDIEPVGVIGVPGEVSVTVAVQIDVSPITTVEGTQATVVDVARLFTTTLVVPLLELNEPVTPR